MKEGEVLRDEVRRAYAHIAQQPEELQAFPTGRALAEDLGYPAYLLDSLLATSVEAFCGVSNVSVFAQIPTDATVLDLGCGAGLDTFIAAKRTAAGGKVIAVDFSQAMLDRAARLLFEAQLSNVELLLSDAEHLPLADESIDVAILNGLFNLNPYREQIFAELARVVKGGGTVYASELVLSAPLPDDERESVANWTS